MMAERSGKDITFIYGVMFLVKGFPLNGDYLFRTTNVCPGYVA